MTTSTNSGAVTVRLTIPARAEYITLCRLALTGIGRLRELSDELSEGGLGIAIIRAIADEVEIGVQPGGKGSRLRFAKALI